MTTMGRPGKGKQNVQASDYTGPTPALCPGLCTERIIGGNRFRNPGVCVGAGSCSPDVFQSGGTRCRPALPTGSGALPSQPCASFLKRKARIPESCLYPAALAKRRSSRRNRKALFIGKPHPNRAPFPSFQAGKPSFCPVHGLPAGTLFRRRKQLLSGIL